MRKVNLIEKKDVVLSETEDDYNWSEIRNRLNRRMSHHGRKVDSHTKAVILKVVLFLVHTISISTKKACRIVNKMFHKSNGSSECWLNQMNEEEEDDIENEDEETRNADDNHDTIRDEVVDFIRDRLGNGFIVKVKHVQEYLREEKKIEWKYEQVRRYLLSIGATFGITQLNPSSIRPRDYSTRVAEFIGKYDEALKLQAKGEASLIYLDESTFYTNMASKYSWHFHDPTNSLNNDLLSRDFNVGKSFKLVHAVCQEGLVGIPTIRNRNPLKIDHPNLNAFAFQGSAEMMIEPKEHSSKTPVAFDSDLFIRYVSQVLIPSIDQDLLSHKIL